MPDNISFSKKIYLFFITFLSILAVCPIMADLFVASFFGEIFFITPFPTNIYRFFIILSGAFVISYGLLFYSIRKNTTEKLEYISIGILRYTLVFAMMAFYGFAKLLNKQFQLNYSSLEMPMKDVNSFYLTWYFYGRDNSQALLYGLFEFVPGFLLLFRRTTLLGAFLLLPVVLNVLLVNIFNQISWLTFQWSILFVLFDIGILLFYSGEIKDLFIKTKTKFSDVYKSSASKILIKSLKIIFIFAVLGRFGTALYKTVHTPKSKCYGIYDLSALSYNNKVCVLDSLNDYWKKLYFEKRNAWNNNLKNKKGESVFMRYTFFNNRDSIKILTYNNFDKDGNPTDSTIFKGIYMYNATDSLLTLTGMQNEKLMEAVYKKLPIDGYDWWW